ncbi:MAG: hypothetical protein M0Z58_04530 [Nitrospiraceae bacterium]|nr:hypothetical protein [Nitrospiraceae bacterium]
MQPRIIDGHRHHAVDAAVAALADSGMIRKLSDAARQRTGKRLFAEVAPSEENPPRRR